MRYDRRGRAAELERTTAFEEPDRCAVALSHNDLLLLFPGLFRRGQIATLGKNTRALSKLGLEKAGRFLENLPDIRGDDERP